jgi:hypothetical protein
MAAVDGRRMGKAKLCGLSDFGNVLSSYLDSFRKSADAK